MESTLRELRESNMALVSEIEPRLFIGTSPVSADADLLRANNITAMVSLLAQPLPGWDRADVRQLVPPENHLFVPVRDDSLADVLAHLSDICDFVDAELAKPIPGGVMVHCRMGQCRSPAVVAAYLMRKYGRGPDSTLDGLREKRPGICPLDDFVSQLHVWEATGYCVWDGEAGPATSGPATSGPGHDGRDRDRKVPKAAYQAYLDGVASRRRLREALLSRPGWQAGRNPA